MNPPYSDPGPLLSQADIETAERRIGVQLPPVVQRLYLASNGGSPEPYVFSDENIDTVVSEFLQLTGGSRGTALECYQRLVEKKKLTPAHFVPFGVDGGGDYFLSIAEHPTGPFSFCGAIPQPVPAYWTCISALMSSGENLNLNRNLIFEWRLRFERTDLSIYESN